MICIDCYFGILWGRIGWILYRKYRLRLAKYDLSMRQHEKNLRISSTFSLGPVGMLIESLNISETFLLGRKIKDFSSVNLSQRFK